VIVFIGGMPRSGSTFSFNIARDILERRGNVYQEPDSHLLDVIERSSGSDHIVLKAHCADDLTIRLIHIGAVKAVVTVRKPEDAIASWMDTFGFSLDESIQHMTNWIEMFQRLQDRALIIPYDQIDRHPLRAVESIAGFLCGDVDPAEIADLAKRYSKERVKEFSDRIETSGACVKDIGFSHYDSKTFFHRRHVSTLHSQEATQRIGQELVFAIRRSLGRHVDRNGELTIAEMIQASGRTTMQGL
jgi:Sulfotransferase domain